MDHPNAAGPKRVKASARKDTLLDASRTQVALAPELQVTFQNIQGQTIRGPEKEPKGFVVDLFRPQHMNFTKEEDGGAGDGRAEFYQHVYMGLGRAETLDRLLIRNFPRDEAGNLDWSFFEEGPPQFLVQCMEELEKRALETYPKLEQAQQELGAPAWEDVPQCEPDKDNEGRFKYDAEAWGRTEVHSRGASPTKRPRTKHDPSARVLAAHLEPATSQKRRPCMKADEADANDVGPIKKRMLMAEGAEKKKRAADVVQSLPLRIMPVSTSLRASVRTHLGNGVRVQSQETGGGGDCLYLSLAAVLQKMWEGGDAAAAHVRAKIPEELLAGGRMALARHLRHLTAERFNLWSWEDLLNFILRAVQDKTSGQWQDEWNPVELLAQSHLSVLTGYESCVFVSDSPDGDVGDVVVKLESTPHQGSRIEDAIPITQGLAHLRTMLAKLQAEYHRCGNHHWGDVNDLKALSDSLDLGVCTFCDRLQARGFLYNNCFDRGDFPFFVALWWFEPTHFRMAELSMNAQDTFRSFWSVEDLPAALRTHYDKCNPQDPVGAAYRGDVS